MINFYVFKPGLFFLFDVDIAQHNRLFLS